MGDDEQQCEVAEWRKYIEDPPEGELEFPEDEGEDYDAEDAYDWASQHPRAEGPDGSLAEDDLPAERSAVRERRGP